MTAFNICKCEVSPRYYNFLGESTQNKLVIKTVHKKKKGVVEEEGSYLPVKAALGNNDICWQTHVKAALHSRHHFVQSYEVKFCSKCLKKNG